MDLLEQIHQRIIERSQEVEGWIEKHSRRVRVPLYTSVDLRASSYKIAPVDTNVFPAGFNNLCPVFRERTAALFKDYFHRNYPYVQNILIVPELLTRNLYYWENIFVLKTILESVGFKVEIGLVSDEMRDDVIKFRTAGGKELRCYKIRRKEDQVFISHFVPDLLLINNDFSLKCPEILKNIRQPVDPPVEIGWHSRRKNIHFEFYNNLAVELAKILEIDPWIITVETVLERDIDFDSEQDRNRLADKVDLMIDMLENEYKRRKVEQKPFVFVKSNSGTYGMAVISVSSGEEIRKLNAEGRKRMRVTKSGKPVRDVVIQEGIPTSIKDTNNVVGEPVVYLVEAKVAGGFLRLNREKTEFDNLNTRGMEFVCISFGREGACERKECEGFFPAAYQVVSRVASIAAGYEIEKVIKEGACRD
jgi:glutamate--cysteine ligase